MTRRDYGSAYEQGFHPTVKFLLSKGISHDSAEEIAQAAWTRGWERIAQLRDAEVLRTWIITIALNLYRRNSQADSRRQPLIEVAIKQDQGSASLEVERLLDSCRPSDRVLLQCQLHGLTTTEMAREVGTTEAAVRIRLMRARRAARLAAQARASQSRVAA